MKFSLVIPVAPERNAEIIESLKEIDYPKSEFHVVVVRGKNPSENRNKGVEKSRGEIIGFLDDDAIADREMLKKVERFFEIYPEIDIVGGPQLTPSEDKGFAKISGYALSSVFGAWKIANRYSGKNIKLNADETMLTSANLFCKRKVFDRIKFNPKLYPGEDPDFISKAGKYGFKVAFSPDLVIYHKRRQTLSELARQIYNYGVVRPKKESFAETLKMPFFLVPSLFLFYLAFLATYLIFNLEITGSVVGASGVRSLDFFFSLPLFIYIGLSILFSFYNSVINRDLKAFSMLPLIYLAIHLSYGFGFIKGTFENIFVKRINNLNPSNDEIL